MQIHKLSFSVLIVFLAASMSGCTTTSLGKSQGPSQVLETGILATEFGQGLDAGDRRRAAEAEYKALETGLSGAATEWKSPKSGVSGVVVAEPAYEIGGTTCRRYTHVLRIQGGERTAAGTACRQENAVWSPLN